MSKKPYESGFPPLQAKVLKYLAENGPTGPWATKQALNSHYANVRKIFEIFEQRGLIEKHQGQPQIAEGWWITPDGLVKAIDVGANPGEIAHRAKDVLSEGKKLEMVLGICKFAVAQKENWLEESARENLLWRYIEYAEPVLNAVEKAKKAKHPFAVVKFALEPAPDEST